MIRVIRVILLLNAIAPFVYGPWLAYVVFGDRWPFWLAAGGSFVHAVQVLVQILRAMDDGEIPR